ncbi:ATP-binding cassette domain-containing protein [Candidatus Pelagibacter sp.]|jgi:lipopolysaccharide export system ATP-binding protein|nr:ATP-binding cassette domain-containing protein [Candidatus Pelagibacter sp.]
MALIKTFRIKKFKIKNSLAKLEKVSLSYDKRQILDDINLNLNSGEIIGLLGPNGAGKSTIFNLLIGLVKPNFGKIIINNNNVNEEPVYIRAKKYKIGYVPQYGGYFHDLTLLENLKAAGEILIKNESDRITKINQLISKFALDNVQEIKARFLSGGQKRKLVICMALLSDPKILLCDEIFAALDVLTIHMLKEILVNLQRENPKMCIMICEHQARELLSIVDRALVLSNCKIIAEGSPNNLVKNEIAKSHYFGNFF